MIFIISLSIFMQKTTLFGRSHIQPQQQHLTKQCHFCIKFQAQITDLNNALAQSQASLQAVISGCENEVIKQMQTELLDIKDKYSSLKKRVKQVEKDNDELFAENTRIEKQLSACRSQLKSYEEASKETVMQQKTQITVREGRTQSGSNDQSQIKQMQVQLFVWQEKAKQLETINRDQSDQIVKLKEYLRKRNKQQVQRHRLLQQFA